MNLFTAPIVLGCSILINAPLWWNWSLGSTVMVFAGIFVFILILMRVLKLWGDPKL